MRVGTEIPRVGTTFEWDVAEILERWSHDLYYNFEGNGYARECVVCGTIWTSDGSWGGTGDPCPRDDCEDFRDVPMARLWDLLLNEKRENEHFGDVLESVTRNGIVRPLTAYEREGVLILCDGHHRLAASLMLGMTAVLVRVTSSFECAEDSGEWSLEDEIAA
jgi:hypothetical protein